MTAAIFIIRTPYTSNFMAISDSFVSHQKNWSLSRGNFAGWGHALVAFTVVVRFKQEAMYRLSART